MIKERGIEHSPDEDYEEHLKAREYTLGGVSFREQDDGPIERRLRQEGVADDTEWNRSRFVDTIPSDYELHRYEGVGPRGYKRTDERIHEDVCEALWRSQAVDASDIEVKVKDGIVTLEGTVSDRRSKKSAEACVEKVIGVTDVMNAIRIKPRL